MFYFALDRSVDEPEVASLAPYQVPESAVPENVRAVFAGVEQILQERLLLPHAWYMAHDAKRGGGFCLRTFRDQQGTTLGRYLVRWSSPDLATITKPSLSLLSTFPDHTFLLSTASDTSSPAPPACRVNQIVGASLDELYASHDKKLAASASVPSLIADPGALLEGHHTTLRDFYLQNDIFRDDQEPLAGVAGGDNAETADSDEMPVDYASTLSQIRQLENKKPGWGRALVILVVTLVIFFYAGAAVWSWRFVLMVVPILLFHELGHYVAMRMFGYQNLTMFFIPLFGAAVSGQHRTAAGWKKGIVALAGPVPGIIVGFALGIVSSFANSELLFQASMLMLILNGFNLLPFLPLDGGHVVHTILFSRHPAFDAAFRIVAAIALILGGLAIGTIFLPIIGVFMLFGVPLAFRLARLAVNLRQRNLVSPDTTNHAIPTETAIPLIAEVKKLVPPGAGTKVVAQHVLHVYENVNARPPGLLASLLLAGTHAGSFCATIVGAFLLMLLYHFGIDGLPAQSTDELNHTITSAEAAEPRLRSVAVKTPKASQTIVTSYSSTEEAAKRFESFELNEVPAYRVAQFGQSLIVELPDENEEAIAATRRQLRGWGAQTVASYAQSGLSFSLECQAEDDAAAEAIHAAVNLYFRIPQAMRAVAPWDPNHELSESHNIARRTYLQLVEVADFEDEKLNSLRQQWMASIKQEDSEPDNKQELATKISERIQELTRQHRERVLSEAGEDADAALAELFAEEPRYSASQELSEDEMAKAREEYRAAFENWSRRVGERLGQLPESDAASQFSSEAGVIEREGKTVRFTYVTFAHTCDGPQALVKWLSSQRCDNFKYGFSGFSEFERQRMKRLQQGFDEF